MKFHEVEKGSIFSTNIPAPKPFRPTLRYIYIRDKDQWAVYAFTVDSNKGNKTIRINSAEWNIQGFTRLKEIEKSWERRDVVRGVFL